MVLEISDVTVRFGAGSGSAASGGAAGGPAGGPSGGDPGGPSGDTDRAALDRAALDHAALDHVSLDIGAGEVLGILGPSGSGKSTLLRAICGLETLEAGTVLWNGTNITDQPVHERGFALMFQDGQLFTHQSVAQNVGYALRVRRLPTAARVDELLTLVGLDGFGDRRVTSLSGGEQQRVALARSLAASPRLLLLDEPLSSLDRELRERLARDLRSILTATAQSAIFVTHDHNEAFAVCDRVAILIDGRLVQVGTPAQLRAAPSTAAVARFLGLDVADSAPDNSRRTTTGDPGHAPSGAPGRAASVAPGNAPTDSLPGHGMPTP